MCVCLRWQKKKKIATLAILRIKVTVKVTRSLTLVSFERIVLVEYACQILSLYLVGKKLWPTIKFFFCHRHTDRHTQQKKKLDTPRIPLQGHKNSCIKYVSVCILNFTLAVTSEPKKIASLYLAMASIILFTYWHVHFTNKVLLNGTKVRPGPLPLPVPM